MIIYHPWFLIIFSHVLILCLQKCLPTHPGWWFEPLWKIYKHMSSSIEMIRFPVYGKIIQSCSSHHQPENLAPSPSSLRLGSGQGCHPSVGDHQLILWGVEETSTTPRTDLGASERTDVSGLTNGIFIYESYNGFSMVQYVLVIIKST